MKFLLDGIGAIVAGTSFNGFDRGIRHKLQYVARFETDILHAQMARHLISDLAQGLFEVRFSLPSLWRSIRYSNGSYIASRTLSTSGSSGNISGSFCLYISVQDGTGVTISQPLSAQATSSGIFAAFARCTDSR